MQRGGEIGNACSIWRDVMPGTDFDEEARRSLALYGKHGIKRKIKDIMTAIQDPRKYFRRVGIFHKEKCFMTGSAETSWNKTGGSVPPGA